MVEETGRKLPLNRNFICVLKGVITIDLIEALQKQMNFCENKEKYKCGIYVENPERIKIVANVISNLLPVPNRNIELKMNRYDTGARWQNGSIIKIINASENVRGQRFNGVIIDNDIDNRIVSCVIMSAIRPIRVFNEETDNGMYERIYTVGISKDDVEKSKKYITKGLRSNRIIVDDLFFMNEKIFKKEYEPMFISNEYNAPIRTIEKDNNNILVFNALGIPRENIEYKTEFVNKSKESYLVVQGSVELKDLNYENGINIRMKIDTDIYDGYDIYVENGLVFVRLHEIVNEAPVLKDYGINE